MLVSPSRNFLFSFHVLFLWLTPIFTVILTGSATHSSVLHSFSVCGPANFKNFCHSINVWQWIERSDMALIQCVQVLTVSSENLNPSAFVIIDFSSTSGSSWSICQQHRRLLRHMHHASFWFWKDYLPSAVVNCCQCLNNGSRRREGPRCGRHKEEEKKKVFDCCWIISLWLLQCIILTFTLMQLIIL